MNRRQLAASLKRRTVFSDCRDCGLAVGYAVQGSPPTCLRCNGWPDEQIVREAALWARSPHVPSSVEQIQGHLMTLPRVAYFISEPITLCSFALGLQAQSPAAARRLEAQGTFEHRLALLRSAPEEVVYGSAEACVAWLTANGG